MGGKQTAKVSPDFAVLCLLNAKLGRTAPLKKKEKKKGGRGLALPYSYNYGTTGYRECASEHPKRTLP